MASAHSVAHRLDSVRQDAGYALRALRRTPLASVVMVASVALGVAYGGRPGTQRFEGAGAGHLPKRFRLLPSTAAEGRLPGKRKARGLPSPR